MGAVTAKGKVRPTIVDGIFYPAEAEKLREMVQGLLSRCLTPPGDGFGVVSPHAGYAYAGDVMAAAFRSMQLRPVKTAVIIGPVHRDPVRGMFLPESELFSTPLGPLSVDRDAVNRLLSADPAFTLSDVPHLEEHCLEVQLPFLAHLFPGVSIVPLLIGEAGMKIVEILSRALRSTFDASAESVAYVASANMASYMRGTDPTNESETIMTLIEHRDWRGIAAAVENGGISTCGAVGIAALLSLGGPGLEVTRLAEADSRGIDGDINRAVHYASFAMTRGPDG
jgi:hypothetical protein